MTEGVLPGETSPALSSLFPAATTVVTPEATRLVTASLAAAIAGPAMLTEATEGQPLALAATATQSIPEMLSGT